MNDYGKRIASLSPEQRKVFEQLLREKGLHMKNGGDLKGNRYSSIKPAPKKEYYAVSSSQKRMYLLNRFEQDITSYNIPGAMMVEGEFDKVCMEEALKALIKRHEALRTSFILLEEEPVQVIHEDAPLEIMYKRASQLEVNGIIGDFIKPFDLSKAPLFRVGLIEISPIRHIMVFDMHHIIADGTSLGVLTREFGRLYNGESLKELRIQYKDFSEWQNVLLQSEDIKEQEKYWQEKFEGEIPVLGLPADFPRPAVQSFEGSSIDVELTRELTSKLNRLTSSEEATLYMTLLAAFNVMLYKYTGQDDIIVGSPIAGRNHADLDDIIGMFLNTLAMRNRPQGIKTFREFFREVRQNALKAYENQDYQFEELVEKLEIERDISRNPLFDVMFVLQNTDDSAIELSKLKFTPYKFENKTAKFDLTLFVKEANGKIVLKFEYCTRLFRKETIERMISRYKNILEQAVQDPDILIADMEVLTEEEKARILYDFNNTRADYPGDKTIHQLFEEQAKKTPDRVAVVFEDKQLTYGQLNQRANRLAGLLRKKGASRESIVGVMAERSIEMVIGIIAVLKAGGAYLPIDHEYPQRRIDKMAEDSSIQLLLTSSGSAGKVRFRGEVIDIGNSEVYAGEDTDLENINMPQDALYVIYTSGSTGKPKGVVLEHRNLTNLIYHEYQKTNIDFSQKVLQYASISFDVSFQEIFSTLLAGGQLYIAGAGLKKDVDGLLQYIRENDITTVSFPTAFLKFMMNEEGYAAVFPDCVRHIVTAGEQLVISDRFRNYIEERDIYLHNHYGPTETHVATTLTIGREDEISEIPPIGKPISNSRVYILSKDMFLQPAGIEGELYIAGTCVGRGYLNRPELTNERFKKDPFMPGERMYKTGDLARWLPDGNLEFAGRIDHQVKIRGFRIELGEIEVQLLKHEDVKEAVVIAKDNAGGNKYLCAYISTTKELSTQDLKAFISNELPDYMIPAYFVFMDKMPLNTNGKIDRNALPEPDAKMDTGTPYEPPADETQEKLVKIWQEVLNLERVGIKDNFFELGGHSLKVISVISRIHRDFGLEIALRDIFNAPTIKELASKLENSEVRQYFSIRSVGRKDYYPLSAAQKRMYVLNRFERSGTSYNMPGAVLIEGQLDKDRLEAVFTELVNRHEVFRTSFSMVDGEPVQRIHPEAKLEIKYIIADESKVIENIKGFVQPFDLGKAPLLRVGLIEMPDCRYVLMFDMHHIISDGVSMGILTREFGRIYQGEALPELKLQYKDFTEWQNEFLTPDERKKQEEYWLSEFDGEIPVLNMPSDYPRPAVRSLEGNSIYFGLSEKASQKLHHFMAKTETTLYMTLLAAFNVLLHKYTGQEDIIIGCPTAGRNHADLESIIGMFVNTLAIRNRPQSTKTFSEFLREVKENTLKVFENQHYQFEELLEKLDIKRDTGRNPLFDVLFVLQNTDQTGLELDSLKISLYPFENRTSKFDLTLYAAEVNGMLGMGFEYCTNLYKRETVERLAQHLINILEQIVENPEIPIDRIDMLTEKEKQQLLYDFNNTHAEYPKEKTIHRLFEEQVERTPDYTAVVFEDKQMTYRELNQKANQLARVLRENNLGQDTIVGIMMEHSLEMMIGIFGILKAGGAYLPIDPGYPGDRIRFMLEDSGIRILLTKGRSQKEVTFDGMIIDLDDETLYENRDDANLEDISNPQSLAYIIYTSGTTGKPKGVMIEHYNVVRLLFNDRIQFDFRDDDVWTLFHSYCFDFSVWEMYGALLYGGKLIVIPRMVARDTAKYLEVLKKQRVTVLNQTPTAFYSLVEEEMKSKENSLYVRYVIFGGEALKPMMLKGWRKKYPGTRLINMYGITETTVHVTYKEITEKEIESNISNIGEPIPTLTTYIMDSNMKLQPIGVPGELCVGGEGLGRGYLNRPELTQEKFVQNPYKPGERIYRSGDLARITANGEMEYYGRIDRQVKIRGHRIELGEIEMVLLKNAEIKEAVVAAKEDAGGDKYLCAYLVSSREFSVQELRGTLEKDLPHYMVPSYFIKVGKIPLTSNGKADIRALPEPEANIKTGTAYEAPGNEVEEKLASIWSDILKVEKIGIHDNFFGLGGHSLKATNLIAKVNQEFVMDLNLIEVFNHQTIASLAQVIEENLQMRKSIEDLLSQAEGAAQ